MAGLNAIPDKAERARLRAREWYANNRERAIANVRAYRLSHKPEINKHKKKYRHVNNDRLRRYFRDRYRLNKSAAFDRAAKRRAMIRGARIGSVDRADIIARSRGICAICRGRLGRTIHLDHIVPLSKGGAHCAENLQATHPICNMRKGAR